MSIYDLLMLAVMVGSILFGLWKGLAWQMASLAAIFVSYFVALNFRGSLAPLLSVEEPWNRFAAMLILFLGTSLIIWMAYGYLKKTIKRLRLRGFDAQAGGLLGAFKGALLCMLITLFSVTVFGSGVRDAVVASKSGGYIAASIDRLNAMVPPEIHAVLNPHVQEFNKNLDTHSPGFVNQSHKKLDEKLKTIKGKLQLPESPTSQRFTSSGETLPPVKDRDYVPPEVRTLGDEIVDTAKEAGRKFVEENFNR
jgi:membrane protein required for colicin V production